MGSKTIQLRGKYGTGKFVIVDEEDYPYLSKFSWRGNQHGYAIRSIKRNGKTIAIRMHRELMGFPEKYVDHINGNKLDNRKENLRLATNTENVRNQGLTKMNKTGYKGAHWNTKAKKWASGITVNNEFIYLGYYDDIEEAAKTYDYWAKHYFGEFARTNGFDLTNFEPKVIEPIKKTSKYRGVHWNKHKQKWRAVTRSKGKEQFIGYFKDEKEAALAYDEKAYELRGEKAILNFPNKRPN